MGRTKLLQKVRKMRFEEACPGPYPSSLDRRRLSRSALTVA